MGFYAAFMVADEVSVVSKPYGAQQAYRWNSTGADGYTLEPWQREGFGTDVILHIKPDTEDEDYTTYLDSYTLRSLIKKYSDYIRHPIKMDVEHSVKKEGTENEYETIVQEETINSMVPIWQKNKKEVTTEEYESFYRDKFFDYEKPLLCIPTKVEGSCTYAGLLYIPAHAPYDYYTREYEKGLQLYSSGVMIMEKCADLLPDYFNFVRGLIDSEDLSLNISREMLQHNRQLQLIEKSVEKKIKNEFAKCQKDDREKYKTFFAAFGRQIKFGCYSDYGTHKELLEDLLIFYSAAKKDMITLKEYVQDMKEGQTSIFYAVGDTVDKIDMLPQTERLKNKGFDVLYMTEDIDEFALTMMGQYQEKKFVNICAEDADIDTEEEKEALKAINQENKEMLDFMKESLGDQVGGVAFTDKLSHHPVCLGSEGRISATMEKTLNSMPGQEGVRASLVLQINKDHPIAQKLRELYQSDKDKLKKFAGILYSQARLIEGMSVDNPTQLADWVTELML